MKRSARSDSSRDLATHRAARIASADPASSSGNSVDPAGCDPVSSGSIKQAGRLFRRAIAASAADSFARVVRAGTAQPHPPRPSGPPCRWILAFGWIDAADSTPGTSHDRSRMPRPVVPASPSMKHLAVRTEDVVLLAGDVVADMVDLVKSGSGGLVADTKKPRRPACRASLRRAESARLGGNAIRVRRKTRHASSLRCS